FRYSLTSLYFLSTSPPHASISAPSLHDALPIFASQNPLEFTPSSRFPQRGLFDSRFEWPRDRLYRLFTALALPIQNYGNFYGKPDRKSTRLNSSHVSISYGVFCWKKQKQFDITE